MTRVPLKGSDQAGRSGRPVPGMMLKLFPRSVLGSELVDGSEIQRKPVEVGS